MQGRIVPYLAQEVKTNTRQRRFNRSMLFLTAALLLLTACGTIELGAENLQKRQDEPPARLGGEEPATPLVAPGYRPTRA
jgi:hypothetical protein